MIFHFLTIAVEYLFILNINCISFHWLLIFLKIRTKENRILQIMISRKKVNRVLYHCYHVNVVLINHYLLVAGLILIIRGIKNAIPSAYSGTNELRLWLELCYVAGGFLALSTPFVNAYGYAKDSIKIISNNCKIVCPVSCVIMFTAMVGMNYPGYWGWSTVAIITAIFNMLGALGTTLLIPDDEYIETYIT